jgi:NAD(P)-dependent dehydrogenase (short-subunit alcohol dehydrogenase family)
VSGQGAAKPELADKVALVTGGTLGIGLAAAHSLGRRGASVAIVGTRQDHLDDAITALRAAGVNADGHLTDVAVEAEVAAVVGWTIARFGGLDIVVNSAGIQRYGTVVDTSVELWDRVFDVNVKGMFLTAKYAIPHMRGRGGGAIVNVSSVQAFVALPGSAAYVASKGAINSLTRAMARDHAKEGIRVNVVCPGSVDTPMLRWAADQFRGERPQEELVNEWGSVHPMGRMARAEEVGEVIAWLAGPSASFVTGAAIPVDGGLLTTVAVALPTPSDQ